MRKNIVKEKLKKGEPVIGMWVSMGNPLAAEILAHSGLDWLTIDMEHNPIDMDNMLNCFYAIGTTDTVPFVRVPSNDPVILKRILDAGAHGAVIPDIRTPEQAEQAVKACLYPPDGIRGVGNIRGQLYGGPDYFERVNEETCIVLMIEDVAAVRGISEICAVPGIDVLFIGPADLAGSLGVPGVANNQHPDHIAAVQRVLEAGKRFGIPVGIACGGPEEANRRLEEGFLWVTVGSDARLLIAAAKAAVAAVKLPGTASRS